MDQARFAQHFGSKVLRKIGGCTQVNLSTNDL